MSNSKNFIEGMAICQKYVTEDTEVGIFEKSNFSISELKRISKEDLEKLKFLGWNAGNSDYGWADFFKLNYIIL